jgi:FKBP-type peptidyl-prolyl cis-trans isomerase FkpA
MHFECVKLVFGPKPLRCVRSHEWTKLQRGVWYYPLLPSSIHFPSPTIRLTMTFPIKSLLCAASFITMTFSAPVFAQADAAAMAAKETGAVVTASGLVYRSLKDGTGGSPTAQDKVKVHYRGTLPDGKEFDSSYARNSPIEFPLSGVIPCWTEGVQRMKIGGKAKLTCPPGIAYGARGAGGVIPPNATLHFEVELLGINGK